MSRDTRKLANVIARHVALGHSRRDIFAAIKMDRKFRSTSNAKIDAEIAKYQKIYGDAAKANRLSSKDEIRNAINKRMAKGTKLTIGFSFKYEFPSNAKSGRRGVGVVGNMTIDAIAGETVGQTRQRMLDAIQAWVDQHYVISNKRRASQTLKMESIQVV